MSKEVRKPKKLLILKNGQKARKEKKAWRTQSRTGTKKTLNSMSREERGLWRKEEGGRMESRMKKLNEEKEVNKVS